MEEKFNNEKDWTNPGTWAQEVIEQSEKEKKRWFRAFIISLAISVLLLFGFVGTNIYWIYTQNSYEFIYQDGEGQNNYNNNIDGDVSNVTTDKEEKKREE